MGCLWVVTLLAVFQAATPLQFEHFPLTSGRSDQIGRPRAHERPTGRPGVHTASASGQSSGRTGDEGRHLSQVSLNARLPPAPTGLGPLPERDLFPEVADNSLDESLGDHGNTVGAFAGLSSGDRGNTDIEADRFLENPERARSPSRGHLTGRQQRPQSSLDESQASGASAASGQSVFTGRSQLSSVDPRERLPAVRPRLRFESEASEDNEGEEEGQRENELRVRNRARARGPAGGGQRQQQTTAATTTAASQLPFTAFTAAAFPLAGAASSAQLPLADPSTAHSQDLESEQKPRIRIRIKEPAVRDQPRVQQLPAEETSDLEHLQRGSEHVPPRASFLRVTPAPGSSSRDDFTVGSSHDDINSIPTRNAVARLLDHNNQQQDSVPAKEVESRFRARGRPPVAPPKVFTEANLDATFEDTRVEDRDFNGLRGRQRPEQPRRGNEIDEIVGVVSGNNDLNEEVTEKLDNNFAFFLPTQRPREPLPVRNRFEEQEEEETVAPFLPTSPRALFSAQTAAPFQPTSPRSSFFEDTTAAFLSPSPRSLLVADTAAPFLPTSPRAPSVADTAAPFAATTPRSPFVVTTMLDDHPTTRATSTSFTGGPNQNRFPSFTAVPLDGSAVEAVPARFTAFPAVTSFAENEIDSEITTRGFVSTRPQVGNLLEQEELTLDQDPFRSLPSFNSDRSLVFDNELLRGRPDGQPASPPIFLPTPTALRQPQPTTPATTTTITTPSTTTTFLTTTTTTRTTTTTTTRTTTTTTRTTTTTTTTRTTTVTTTRAPPTTPLGSSPFTSVTLEAVDIRSRGGQRAEQPAVDTAAAPSLFANFPVRPATSAPLTLTTSVASTTPIAASTALTVHRTALPEVSSTEPPQPNLGVFSVFGPPRSLTQSAGQQRSEPRSNFSPTSAPTFQPREESFVSEQPAPFQFQPQQEDFFRSGAISESFQPATRTEAQSLPNRLTGFQQQPARSEFFQPLQQPQQQQLLPPRFSAQPQQQSLQQQFPAQPFQPEPLQQQPLVDFAQRTQEPQPVPRADTFFAPRSDVFGSGSRSSSNNNGNFFFSSSSPSSAASTGPASPFQNFASSSASTSGLSSAFQSFSSQSSSTPRTTGLSSAFQSFPSSVAQRTSAASNQPSSFQSFSSPAASSAFQSFSASSRGGGPAEASKTSGSFFPGLRSDSFFGSAAAGGDASPSNQQQNGFSKSFVSLTGPSFTFSTNL